MAALTKEQVRQIIANAPRGTSPKQIVDGLRARGHTLDGYDDTTQAEAPAALSTPQSDLDRGLTGYVEGYGPRDPKWTLESLPATGGFLGGLAGTAGGPPGRALGAGIGGALGEGAREIGSHEPPSFLHMGQRGMEQAGVETLGGVLGHELSMFARPLMRKSLGNVSALAKRFNLAPKRIAEVLLKERFPNSEAGEEAAQGAADAVRTARNATLKGTYRTLTPDMLAEAAIQGAERSLQRPLTRIERNDLIRTVQAEADQILTNATHGAVPKAQPGTPGIPAQPASKLFNQYGQPAIPAQPAIPGTPPPPSRYTPWETEQIKEVAASDAAPDYLAAQSARSVAADPSLSKRIASSARAELNTIPGIRGDNKRLSHLMAAQQAIHDALAKDTGEWAPAHLGPFSVGVKLPRKALSKAALALTGPRFQPSVRQSPRVLAAILEELLHTEEPDATGASR